MCPEPALLVAYLDGTLFHRDAHAIDAHIDTCASCSELLAAMRRHREDEERSRRVKSVRRAAIAIAAVALLAIGVWTALMRPRSRASEIAPPRQDAAPVAASAAASNAPSSSVPVPAANAPVTDRPLPVERRTQPAAAAPGIKRRSPSIVPRATTSPRVDKVKAPPAAPKPKAIEPAAVPDSDSGLTLRGRNANRRIVWRVRDRAIEHSTDGGVTWATEHTVNRAVRAGAFVNADVAWLVGENGLVLRRTKNGWFDATPPAEGTVTAVRASSPSKAAVTLEDGRVFTTENGGVTWSTP
jgi:hypothetical protein